MNKTHPVQALPQGWETRNVFCNTSRGPKNRLEIIDSTTGIRYRYEPMHCVAIKSFLIFLGAIPYATLYMAWHLVRTPIAASLALVRGQPGAAFRVLEGGLWAIAKTPFCTLGLMFCGLYGVFSPLEGRKMIAGLESTWHQRQRRDDEAHTPGCVVNKLVQAVNDPDSKTTKFLAYCMQPLGSLQDERVTRSEVVLPGTMTESPAA